MVSASNRGNSCPYLNVLHAFMDCCFCTTQFYQHAVGKILLLACRVDDISNLSLCRHTVIYDFSHAAKRALGVSLLHLKPITVK